MGERWEITYPENRTGQFFIEETFDVGEDTGSPVVEAVHTIPFRCEALKKLTVKRVYD